MTGHPTAILSYGMGTDSTALLLRWICEPQSRPCDLPGLLVVTAQTGDEWAVTGELVTHHMLPLLRRHHIRWAQVARAGPRQADGIAVLSDTREPTTVHLRGAYRLSQELLAAGTVPQAGGARRCSLKAKGWPLDRFIAQNTSGTPYLHAIGYESGELSRAVRDAAHNTPARTGCYPLIEWGWDRRACENYIRAVLGTDWAQSACTYCLIWNLGSLRLWLMTLTTSPATSAPSKSSSTATPSCPAPPPAGTRGSTTTSATATAPTTSSPHAPTGWPAPAVPSTCPNSQMPGSCSQSKTASRRCSKQLDLTDDERAALEGDRDAVAALAERLADTPTPSGPTPRELGTERAFISLTSLRDSLPEASHEDK
jgi:hypothetical protein